MLGKLIKYEFFTQAKEYIGGYVLIFVVAVMNKIFKAISLANPKHIGWEMAYTISEVFLFMGVIGIFIGSALMALLRFRKNLLRDEGYLMHTLPVTENKLILSKTLTNLIWFMIHIVYILLLALFCLGSSGWHELMNSDAIHDLTKQGCFTPVFVVLILICIVMAYVNFISQIQLSLSIGYRAKENKDLMSIVAYVGIYVIGQIISVIGVVIFAFGIGLNPYITETDIPTQYIFWYLILMAVISILISVIFHFITVWSMKYHLNLE